MRHLTFFISLLMALNCMGQGVSPTRDVEATDDGIIVTYRFHGGFHQDDPLHPGAKFWKIPGFALNDVAGEPCFPFHWDTFAVPDDCEVVLTLLDSTYTDTLFTLAPAYPPLLMSDTIGYTPDRVPPIVAYPGLYPNNSVLKGENQNYRGQELARVAIMPVQYNYNTHTVRSFSMIKYMVSFTRNGSQVRGRDYASSSSNISISDHFLENTTLNYSFANNNRQNFVRQNGDRSENTALLDNRGYMIITTDNFLDAVNEFADWKRTKGFSVLVTSKQAGEWTVSDIKNYITEQYERSTIPYYYLLIVGDKEYVPTETLTNNKNHISDYYYGHRPLRFDTLCLHQGRIPVKTNNQARTVFHKIMEYERNPSSDFNYYKNITTAAYYQELYVQGREHMNLVTLSEQINNYLSNDYTINRIYRADQGVNPLLWYNGDSIPPFLRKPPFEWDGKTEDISAKINEGNFLFIYSGHGLDPFWSSIEYGEDDIDTLHNSKKLPVVISRACLTGNFGYCDPCFAEMFLMKENAGCVAIIAATNDSYNDTNSFISTNIIDVIWPGFVSFIENDTIGNMQNCNIPMYGLGEILDYGTKRLLDSNPPLSWSSWIPYEAEIQHLFGDPSMMIYTEKPESITEPEICFGNDTVYVKTTDGPARISFHTTDNYYHSSFIGTEASFRMRNKDVIICIDRHNYIPYVIKVSSSGFIQNETINDSRIYANTSTIKIGKSVTTTKPEGDVLFEGADVKINGGTVELHPGTTIVNSNVEVNSNQ